MMQKLLIVLFLFSYCFGFSQQIDVQHYKFYLQLSDETDRIQGEAEVQARFKHPESSFSLDLVQVKNNGKGMKVDSIKGDNIAGFQQAGDKVNIQLKKAADSISSVQLYYSGIPADGLIISKNKYGDRTFFSDNWPNRAHHWIPCNDAPDDKASVEFLVTAPAHYQVVSNGVKMEEAALDNSRKLTHWEETIPISTKVMVIGAAQFAIARVDSCSPVPVTAWVYPQDKQKGFYDYKLADHILKFFIDYIGPYAFKKLANVQSKTIFGGMENANTIFYTEKSVTGDRRSEALIAHEIAHQWFGNMATEKSFPHLWLSEGFATYMTDIYMERQYGKVMLQQRLREQRDEVIQFNKVTKRPVVDSVSALMDLLNDNSYEKGAWVLHMLRGKLGDTVFQKVIQTYYELYKGSNAETRDFQAVAEKVSGEVLKPFFDQWLFQPGLPKIHGEWKFEKNNFYLTIQQKGENIYQFPLEIGILDAKGKQTVHKVFITKAKETFSFPISRKPAKVVLDPNTALLFEGHIVEN
ncbi:M1 family metallopeptidase [Chitinophagaceae bacterium LB-8]|uniref:Aminopeptidase N n=1 Tax=Paraflavisolibacter caeni TaxID=2982496 RepID=A0A9X3BGF5_9BACT|nr:M1 family metallopeptidase [Paraflavisolibacter caeni]MCU7547688.1 M1 family metallopeptidase [Paraflavisolibacter caeni]